MRIKLICARLKGSALPFALLLGACSSSPPPSTATAAAGPLTVTLSAAQQRYVQITAVGIRDFTAYLDLVGSVDFDQNRNVPVYSAYQGRIERVDVELGQEVQAGQPLYEINSPDLAQAESTLLSAAAIQQHADEALARDRQLLAIKGMASKDYEQALSDQRSAAAAAQAARAGLSAFGLSPAAIARLLASRHVDPQLAVTSPIAGRVIARTAQPGLLVLPGNPPAPISVADLDTVWVEATAPEADSTRLQAGDRATIRLDALPGQPFTGQLSVLGPAIDATTRALSARIPIADPRHQLRPGMYAEVRVALGAATRSPAMLASGIVREGDGSSSAWVTRDGRRFEQRTVRLGLEQDGYVQVLQGLLPGERVAAMGALFLDNAAALAQP